MSVKKGTEVATIDVSLITIRPENDSSADEIALDTAYSIAVEPQVEMVEAVKLVIKGVLKAQKRAANTLTGNTITLTNNVFTPELVLMLQGGTITYDSQDPTKIIKYEPPAAGSSEKGEIFILSAYSAQYDTSGQIIRYEKITYPNCQGTPVAINTEDGVFRVSEYIINSAPKTGESPYIIEYVDALPEIA